MILSKFQYGRPVGVEGNLKTEVLDVKMMLVPNPAYAEKSSCQRVAQAFNRLKKREALPLLSERRLREMAYTKAGKEDQLAALTDLSELDMPDRRELDDAVLELLGISDRKERARLLDELYGYLREFFEWTRQKEEKAIGNKNKAKRKTAASPAEIAAQILDGITQNEAKWLRRYDPDFLDRAQPFDTYDLPQEGEAQATQDMLAASGGVLFAKGKKQVAFISTRNPAQPELMVLLAEHGLRGLTRVPHEEAACLALLSRFEDYLRQRRARLAELVEERTGDPDLQEKVLAILSQQMAAR